MDSASNAPNIQPTAGKCTNSNCSNYAVCMFYDLEEVKNLLRDLTVVNFGQTSTLEIPSTSPVTVDEALKDLKIASTMSCSSCQKQFISRTDQRAHFKSEWHRHNLKQKLKGFGAITLEEFDARNSYEPDTGQEEGTETPPRRKTRRPKPSGLPSHMSGRASPARSNSSSSTDSEDDMSSDADDDADIRRNPKIFFKNGAGKFLSIYRCVLHGKQSFPSHDGELIRTVCSLYERLNWAVILIGGGHFAAAIFNGKDAEIHKTIHRYTVRAKQGSSQSTRDGRQSGSSPRSGGASLRRQNEASLVQDVQILLELWEIQLRKCHTIFYRAPGSNKTILFGGKLPPFKKGDDRLRPIPFPTCRATFHEVQRIHHVLSTIMCFDTLEGAISASQRVQPFHNQFRLSPVHKPKKKKEKSEQILLAQKSRQEEPPSDTFPGATDSDDEVKFIGIDETLDMTKLKMFDCSEVKGKGKKKGKKHRGS